MCGFLHRMRASQRSTKEDDIAGQGQTTERATMLNNNNNKQTLRRFYVPGLVLSTHQLAISNEFPL